MRVPDNIRAIEGLRLLLEMAAAALEDRNTKAPLAELCRQDDPRCTRSDDADVGFTERDGHRIVQIQDCHGVS